MTIDSIISYYLTYQTAVEKPNQNSTSQSSYFKYVQSCLYSANSLAYIFKLMYVCIVLFIQLFSTEFYVLSIQKYKQVNTACGLRTLDFSMIALALLLFCLTYLVLKTAIVRLLIFLTFNFFYEGFGSVHFDLFERLYIP